MHVLALVLALLLSACGFLEQSSFKSLRNNSASQSVPKTKPLRLAYLLNITHAVPIIGIETKAFGDIQAEYFLTGGNVVDALITGNVDLAYFGPGPWINAVSKGIDLMLLELVAYGANTLVYAKPISELRRVAVPQFGNTQDLVARILFQKLNQQVEFIAINTAEMEMAFFTHNIDAALVPEPWGTVLGQKPGLEATSVIEHQGQTINLNEYPATLLLVKRDFYHKHQREVDSFVQAQNRVLRQIQDQPEWARQLVQQHLEAKTKKHLKATDIQSSFAKVRFDNQIKPALLEDLRQAALEARYLRNKIDLTQYYSRT